jgi:hypothetical protein
MRNHFAIDASGAIFPPTLENGTKCINDLTTALALVGKLNLIFKVLSDSVDPEWNFIEGSITKAHQHISGCRKDEEHAFGKLVAGNSSKVNMVKDSSGNPIDFEVTEGQVHDAVIGLQLYQGRKIHELKNMSMMKRFIA